MDKRIYPVSEPVQKQVMDPYKQQIYRYTRNDVQHWQLLITCFKINQPANFTVKKAFEWRFNNTKSHKKKHNILTYTLNTELLKTHTIAIYIRLITLIHKYIYNKKATFRPL